MKDTATQIGQDLGGLLVSLAAYGTGWVVLGWLV